MPVRDGPIALLGANYELIILLVELIFCWGTELRKYGLPLMLTGGAAFVVLPWLVPGLHNAPVFLIGTVSVGHEVMILISLLLIYGSFRVSWQQTFLYGTLAAILQFLWFIAFLLLNAAFNLLSNWWIPVEIVMQLLVYLAAAMLIRPLVTSKERIVIPGKVQVFGCIVTILILHSFYDDLVGILSSPQTHGLNAILWGSMLLALMLSMISVNKAMTERVLMERLLQESEQRHNTALQSAELISQRCHDLKHQIHMLRTMNDEERNAYISELERDVMIYESVFHTGNKTLDVLLGEKKLICDQKSITMTVMADASGLSFLPVLDLYTIFANALDNAIEAVTELPEEERLISVNIARVGQATSVHIENPCHRATSFRDGLPQTTKSDANWHGVGVRSMRRLVEKHGGVLEFRQTNESFITELLFTAV